MNSSINAVLAIHGGAGVRDGHDYEAPCAFLADLLLRGEQQLRQGAGALDLVVDMVEAMEASGLFTAGKGSSPNLAGEVELDASVMSGHDRCAGAVAAVRNVMSPVRTALEVMRRTPHVMLAGAGAEAFVDEAGLARVAHTASYYRAAVDLTRRDEHGPESSPLSHGTVGAVVLDSSGRLAAATSTGGTLNKRPGRVGDSPIIGAATWADDRVAVSCTGQGEFFLRTAAAHDVAARMAYRGDDLRTAADGVITCIGDLGGEGGLIAVDRAGNVAMPFNSGGMKRGVVRPGGRPEVGLY